MACRLFGAKPLPEPKLSVLPAFWEGNPPVTGGFPSQRAGNSDFDVSFDASLNT